MNKLMSSAAFVLSVAVAGALAPATAVAADPAAKPAAPAKPAAKATGKAAGKSAKGNKSAPTGVPAEVRDEMAKLVEQSIQLASPALQTGDTFEPYGVLKMNDGTLKVVRWQKPNPPPAMEVFRAIYLSIMAEVRKNPDVIAAVSVAPSSVPQVGSDARVNGIRAEVDHRRGTPLVVFIPFTHEDGKLILGTPVYTDGTNPVFEHNVAPAAGGKAAPATPAPASAAAPAAPAAPAAGATPAAAPAKP